MTGKPESRLRVSLAALIFFAAASGCTPEAKKEPPAPEFGVKETFNTGPVNFVRAIKPDGRFLWVGTSTGILKVNRLNGEMVETYTVEDGLTSPYIFSINVDPAGGAWFGTDAGGLMKLSGGEWQAYGTQEGLSDLWVYDIAFHPDGTMWVATWNGVSRFDPKAPEGSQFTTYDTTDGLANKWVYGLGIDTDRSMWFGTEEGVSRFDPAAPEGK
ncbi:MAG TPA: two-component regulator propeller domain-containing protein, partial [Nitrospiria bacterium]